MVDKYPISINGKISLKHIILKNLKKEYIFNEVIKLFPKADNITEQKFQYIVLKKIKNINNLITFITKKKKLSDNPS